MNDLRFLRYMIALAEHGHFARAARSLGISQPALSIGIKRLEKEMGVRLFDRARERVALTSFGEVALRHARQVVTDGEELLREVRLLGGLALGSLVVVAGTFAAEISGHRALGRLAQCHPSLRCRIELREWNHCAEMLISREADLALAEVAIAQSDERLVAEVVGTHAGVFYCRAGHPLLAVPRPGLRDLSAYPWALVTLPPRLYRALVGIQPAAGRFDEKHQQFVPAMRVETVSGMKQIVVESDALSAAPRWLIGDEVRRGMLAALPFEAPWLRLNYGFVYLRDRMLSPAARAFMAEVRAVEARIAARASAPAKPAG